LKLASLTRAERSKLRYIQVRAERAQAAEARRCTVSRDSVCARTGAKLGASAFVLMPDGRTILYRVAGAGGLEEGWRGAEEEEKVTRAKNELGR
jgi:hypothetical protein